MHSNEGRMTVTLTDIRREQGAIRRWQADVAEAALPFERRWTLAALKRVDEVATIVANLEVFKPIVAIKRLFPGAEMLDVHPGEQPEKGAVSNEVRGL